MPQLPRGDFYAIWRDSGNFNSGHADIVGRPVDSFGTPIGGDVSLLPLNNAFGVPFNASQPATVALPIAGQANGTATAFTDNFNNGPDFDVYVVRTNASLTRLENPLLIDGSTSVTDDPSVTSFADGSLVVSYTIQNSSTDWDILARTVSAAGVVGPVITLFNDTDRSDLSDLATLNNGNFVAVFESPFLASPTDLDVFFTIKTENGTNVVSPTTVVGAGSTATETDPHVAALASGGFVVTWTDSAGDENGTSQGIRATIYDANGNVIVNGGDILVNQFNQAGTQLSNDVTALPDGGFVVAWEDVAAGVDRAQRFDAAGNLVGTPVTISQSGDFQYQCRDARQRHLRLHRQRLQFRQQQHGLHDPGYQDCHTADPVTACRNYSRHDSQRHEFVQRHIRNLRYREQRGPRVRCSIGAGWHRVECGGGRSLQRPRHVRHDPA